MLTHYIQDLDLSNANQLQHGDTIYNQHGFVGYFAKDLTDMNIGPFKAAECEQIAKGEPDLKVTAGEVVAYKGYSTRKIVCFSCGRVKVIKQLLVEAFGELTWINLGDRMRLENVA